jgi:hypothetical protein
MRVLTTWLYFELSDVVLLEAPPPTKQDAGMQPGVGVAWFTGDTSSLKPISESEHFLPLRVPKDYALTEENLRIWIDLFLRGGYDSLFSRNERYPLNSALVDYVLVQPIVIERSPPITVTLKGLLTTTNFPVWIGTYVGWSVAPEHSVLLFITIPGGIIVVSSATGLARALAAGLAKAVKKAFEGR